MATSKQTNENKINREELINEYNKNFDSMITKLEKVIKKKNEDLGVQKKLIEILNDHKKEGKQKIIEALKNKRK